QATLKLHAPPEAVLAAVALFKDMQSAVNATVAIMQSGLPVARIEFLDENMVDACNRFSKLDLDVSPTLFLEFHGSKSNIDAQGRIADICVPITALPNMISFAKNELQRLQLLGLILGHVGDGNFHVILIFDSKNLEEIKRVDEFSTILAKESLRMNGTITGEHGIGLGKKQLLIDEFGTQGINTMKSIKKALDPLNILNPGKCTQRYASSQALATDLKSIVGNDNVGTSTAIREQHSHDESYHA
ncbi:unnamed protein product, partial [Rotaria sp. Silwood1]